MGRWYFEAGNQMLGASGRDGGGAAGSPESWPRRRRAGGRAGGKTRAPAAPSADPGEQALRGKPQLWAPTGASRLLPASSLPPAHPPPPVPSCGGLSRIIRFRMTPSDLSPRLRERGASYNWRVDREGEWGCVQRSGRPRVTNTRLLPTGS